MEILSLNFKTLSYCGVWSENTKFSFFKSIYKIVVVTNVFYFTTVQAIEFVRTCVSREDSTQMMSICFTYIAFCFKTLNLILRQKEMLSIIKKFRSEIYQPKTPEEWGIFENYTREINRIFLSLMILAQGSGIAILSLPLLETGIKNITLPFKTYQPYDMTNNALYFGTYIWQVFSVTYGILLNISLDSMMYGLLLLICAQYEIFCHRLTKIDDQNEKLSLKKYVDQHVFIQDLISSTQSFFMRVVTPLFFFSLIILGASIFKILQVNSIDEIFAMGIYLSSVLFQIFCYCWFGNELTLKSKSVVHALYSSSWINLDSADRKSLRFIMQMSAKEIVISHHGQCSLNLTTFVWILKTSYSALNVLQQSAK